MVSYELREVALSARYRVIPDAVVGGGFDLRGGQVVDCDQLGHYADILLNAGAIVRLADEPRPYLS